MATSPFTGAVLLAAIVMDEEEDRGFEGSLGRRRSSSFLSEELSKSDILSLDSLR